MNKEIKIKKKKKKTLLIITIFNFVNTKICSKLLGNPPLNKVHPKIKFNIFEHNM